MTLPNETDAGPLTETAVPSPETVIVATPPLYGTETDPEAGPGAGGENCNIRVQFFFGNTVSFEQPSLPATIANSVGTLTDPRLALTLPRLVKRTLTSLEEPVASTLPKFIFTGLATTEVVATGVGVTVAVGVVAVVVLVAVAVIVPAAVAVAVAVEVARLVAVAVVVARLVEVAVPVAVAVRVEVGVVTTIEVAMAVGVEVGVAVVVAVLVGVAVPVGVGVVFARVVSRTACAVSANMPALVPVAAKVGEAFPASGAAVSAKANVNPSWVEATLKRLLRLLEILTAGATVA